MGRHHCEALDAITFELLADCDAYGEDVEQLVHHWSQPDAMELYRIVVNRANRMRHRSAALSGMEVQWVTFLISHTELMQLLWNRRGAAVDARTAGRLDEHLSVVNALERSCRRRLTRNR